MMHWFLLMLGEGGVFASFAERGKMEKVSIHWTASGPGDLIVNKER